MRLTAHQTGAATPIRTAPKKRAWMDATPNRFAYRCLPLVIANQAGWQLCTTGRVEATWNGGIGLSDLTVTGPAASHFGAGILTFQPGYLFRSSSDTQLFVTGPLNEPKDGISALSGIVETEWACATWTMNWKFTRPGSIVFEEGEPFCQIMPMQVRLIEETVPTIRPIYGPLAAAYAGWAQSRGAFNGRARTPEEWERHYMRGESPAGPDAADGQHRTKLKIRGFEQLGT